MVLSFERGKKVTDALEIGRSAAAFKVTEVTLKMVVFYEGPLGSGPNIGRYFRNENEEEWNIPLPKAYSLLQMVLKQKKPELRKLLEFVLEKIDHRATAHFTFFFKGEPGELKPEGLNYSSGNYHWRDLEGFDLIVDNKMLRIPEGRILPNSDFQFCLDGEMYPSRPADTI